MLFHINKLLLALSLTTVVVVSGQGQGQGPDGQGPPDDGQGGGNAAGRCNICGAQGMRPTTPDATLMVPDPVDPTTEMEITCGDLRMAGANGLVEPDDCPAIQELAKTNCSCGEGGDGGGGGGVLRPGNRKNILGKIVSQSIIVVSACSTFYCTASLTLRCLVLSLHIFCRAIFINIIVKKSAGCVACREDMKNVKQCHVDNKESCKNPRECLKGAKESGLDPLDALNECICDACSDLVETVTECVSENCVPDCVRETTRTYFECARNDDYDCKDSCDSTIEEIKEDYVVEHELDVDSLDDVKLRDAIFNIEVVGGVQDAEMELTCANIESKFEETRACDLGNCCPYCVDEFEDMAACAVNTAVAFENDVEGDTATDIGCEFDCGDNIVYEDESDGRDPDSDRDFEGDRATEGDRDGSARGRGRRALQADPDIPEDVEKKLKSCQENMSKTLAVGESGTAADNFLNCAIETLLPNSAEEGGGEDATVAASGVVASSYSMLIGALLVVIVSNTV